MKSKLINWLVLIGTLFGLADALTYEYHYVDPLVGNRAAGLGGAYAAIADDPAGCF